MTLNQLPAKSSFPTSFQSKPLSSLKNVCPFLKFLVYLDFFIITFVLLFAVSAELEQLLVKQSSLEVYFEWLDSLIERKVCEVS